MKQKERVLYFDVLNILACIAVITLHHNGMVHSFENTLAWKESLVAECGFYWAVPVFLMLSGANLLGYREKYDTATFFKKRVLRTVVPWIAWSVIMLIWKTGTGQLVLESKRQMIDLIINCKVESTYWFFQALFACYLAIPVFSLLTGNRKMLWYTAGLNFVMLSCLPVLKTWFGIKINLDIPVVGGLILYIILGYLLATQRIGKKGRSVLYILGLSAGVFRYVYTYVFSIRNQATDTSIKGYIYFHAVFLSVAVFVWAQNVDWGKYLPGWLLGRLSEISSCSFGIYLIHKIVIYYEKSLTGISTKSLLWRSAFVPVTYLTALVIVWGIRKLPVLKRIV